MKLLPIDNPLCELAEGPLWHPTEQALYWTDIVGRSIWRYQPANGEIRRVWHGDLQIGGFSFRQRGGFLLCTDAGIFIADKKLTDWQKLHDIPFRKGERFNDIITDPQGRIFAGTLAPDFSDGTLYRLEPGHEPKIILEQLGISNGMGFSPDGEIFYHTDTLSRRITAYDCDTDSGDIGNPRQFYQGLEEDGYPDGMTVDREGFIWTACWGASQILRLDTNGNINQRLAVPAKQPSSVTFGGDQLKTLFITSAYQGNQVDHRGFDHSGNFIGGKLYQINCPASGLPEYFTRY